MVYRSASSDEINNDKLFQILQKAASHKGISHIMIMGDLYMPEIKWNSMYVQANNDPISSNFFTLLRICFYISILKKIQGLGLIMSPRT